MDLLGGAVHRVRKVRPEKMARLAARPSLTGGTDRNMRIRITPGSILALSIPIIFAGVGETIVDVTDTVFLGWFGITELAAVGLADAIYGVATVVALGFVDGIQVIVARRAGEGRSQAIGRTFNQGLYLLGIVGVTLTLMLRFGSPFLTAEVISSPEVRAATDDFLAVASFKLLFEALNLAYSALYVGLSRTRVLIGATFLLAATNVVLDYGLIFGNFGFAEMGIRGAAIASLVAEISAFAFLTIHLLVRVRFRKYGVFAFGRWDSSVARALVHISSPVVFHGLIETLRWFLFFVIIERLGEEALAVSNIVYACFAVLLIALDGFSEVACSMVSNLIGQGKSGRMWELLGKCMSLSYTTTVPLLALVLLFPDVVVSIFTDEPLAIAGSVSVLRIVVLAILIVIPSEIYFSALSGTGDTPAAFVIELVMSICILIFAYGAALSFSLPLEYVWLAQAIGWTICAGLSYLWLRSGRWRRLRI